MGPRVCYTKTGEWWDVVAWWKALQTTTQYNHNHIRHLIRQCRDFRREVQRYHHMVWWQSVSVAVTHHAP